MLRTSEWLQSKRQQLHYGTIASSRAFSTRASALGDEARIVDVGEGKIATLIEELIARLEQHGIRRQVLSEDEMEREAGTEWKENTIGMSSSMAEQHPPNNISELPLLLGNESIRSTRLSATSSVVERGSTDMTGNQEGNAKPHTLDVGRADERSPYYYTCVCCDRRLTAISTCAATMDMLQDIHYHCSTAKHRKSVSWMDDPDTMVTLRYTARVQYPEHYTCVYVNGVPMLLSRHPGGGEMFYPLPHETDLPLLWKDEDETPHNNNPSQPMQSSSTGVVAAANDTFHLSTVSQGVWPDQHTTHSFWYNPLKSISCGAHQHVTLDPNFDMKYTFCASVRRNAVCVEHVPYGSYATTSLLNKKQGRKAPLIQDEKRAVLLTPRKRYREISSSDNHGIPSRRNGQVTDTEEESVLFATEKLEEDEVAVVGVDHPSHNSFSRSAAREAKVNLSTSTDAMPPGETRINAPNSVSPFPDRRVVEEGQSFRLVYMAVSTLHASKRSSASPEGARVYDSPSQQDSPSPGEDNNMSFTAVAPVLTVELLRRMFPLDPPKEGGESCASSYYLNDNSTAKPRTSRSFSSNTRS